MTFADRLAGARRIVADRLDRHLPDDGDRLTGAMRHAMQGGKAFRGFLALESAELHGIATDVARDAALAVECLHAYSLVHDDLPAMDDDDLRRGRPTVHKAWDEATAILAGDALQTMAFGLLADPAFGPNALKLLKLLAIAAGRDGMVRGQMMDIAAESAPEPLTLEQITDLQAGKTGALIGWSASVGPVLAGDDPAPLAYYARALGLAFQIADDILDVTGDEATTGKRVKKDAAAGKATFVSLLGLTEAKSRARALVAEAETALTPYGKKADGLRDAARFVISRDF